jgi:hypothetical protein
VLAALVSLCLKHSDNQSRFASTPHALGDLCFFLGLDRAVKTTLGIAAGLIRMITTNRPLVVLQLVACGAVAKLVAMCAEQESFAQEQAAAALYSLLSLSTEAVTLAHSFEAHTTLGNLVFWFFFGAHEGSRRFGPCPYMCHHELDSHGGGCGRRRLGVGLGRNTGYGPHFVAPET